MIKRLFYFLAAAAVLVSTAACQKSAGAVGEAEAVFDVEFAQNPATKVDGVSEAALIDRLDVFVYDASGAYLSTIVPTVTKTDQTHYKVKIRLLNNVTYSFAFFAQKSGTYAYSANKRNVTVDYSAIPANADAADAFYTSIANYRVDGTFTRPVTLKRPFAQINFGSIKADYQAAEASQVTFDANLKTAIVVKQAPTVLDLLTGAVSSPVDASFPSATYMGNTGGCSTLTVSEKAFPGAAPVRYMGMVYILAADGDATTVSKVGMTVSGKQNGNSFSTTREVTNVPVHRNYRTQIVGNVFTDEGTFNITVDPVYASPDENKNLNM